MSEDELFDVEFTRCVTHRPIYESLLKDGMMLAALSSSLLLRASCVHACAVCMLPERSQD
jgi:hypothetical protein